MSERPAAKVPWIRLILALVVVGLVLAVTLSWLNRRTIARDALTGWLERRGIPAEAEVAEIGPGRFVGRLRVGDPARPDFSASRADIRYRFRGLEVEVLSVTLHEPVLRAQVKGGKLSFGALDPIVEEFLRRPPRPDAAKPRISIDDGVALLATDYGPVRLTADALVEDAKLVSLAAAVDPARLKGQGFDAQTGRGALRVQTKGARVTTGLDLPLARLAAGELLVEDAVLRLNADAPYPDLVKQRTDGAVVLRTSMAARRLTAAGQAVDDVRTDTTVTGHVTGWIPNLMLTGRATSDVRTAKASSGDNRAGGLVAAVTAENLRWSRQGGDRVTAALRLRGSLDQAQASDLALQRVTFDLDGPLDASAAGTRLTLAGALAGRGRWDGLGAPTREDTTELAAIKRAARGFRIAAPGVRLAVTDTFDARLTQPVRLFPDSGGLVTLASPRPDAWRLTVAGGGLPQAEATLTNLRMTESGATGALAVKASASIGPIEGGAVDTAGQFRSANGSTTFTATRCATFRAAKLEAGENDVVEPSGRLCPVGRPLFAMSGQTWRLDGRVEAVHGSVPFLMTRFDGGANVAFRSTAGRLQGEAVITAARIDDTAPERRFHPMALTGRAVLARETWTADLAFAVPAGAKIADAKLIHDGATAQGRIDIDTGRLVFAEGGLQPTQLSPLAARLGNTAVGEVRFNGGLAWNPVAGISAGTLTIPRLDFKSPAGQATNLHGQIVLTSLSPLVSAPDQELRLERFDTFAPLTDMVVKFGVRDEILHVSDGQAAMGGGRVRIESLELPFSPEATTRGVLYLEGVQLHDMVEATPFGDKVELDAKVSGRVPFEALQGRVRIKGGQLKAIQPGRVQIARAALTGVAASPTSDAPGAPPPPPDTITDFAYQAMEHLAFDELELSMDSTDTGRLGAIFRIKGRHDPPQKQQIRLSVIDLIQQKFLGRQLPLPSGTGVNLTLDTTLNLDDLLADYAEYERLRSSGPVQP